MKILSEIKAGSTVRIGSMAWNVLAQEAGKTLCIADGILKYGEFDREGGNNWKKSSLREWLNGEFLDVLYGKLKAGGTGQDAVLEYRQDLTADDGLTDYGSSEDKVFLLTCGQYRNYRQYIRYVRDCWWLITADSAINSLVRSVNTDSTLANDYACSNSHGIRPACAFSSYIEVES